MKKEGDYSGIVLFGPTASGKTSLSIRLAQAVDGEVINADSRQLYKGMRILTAAPSTGEQQGVPHHLFEILDPKEKITVTDYMALAKEAIDDVLSRGKVPILCGGTGFYLNAVREGISAIPEVCEELKDELRDRLSIEGNTALLAELKKADPLLGERLKEGDSQRILRALGVYKQTGRPLSYFQKLPREGALNHKMLYVALQPERAWLNERIEKRYDHMEQAGVEAEMKALKEARYSLADHGIQTLGAREFFMYFDDAMNRADVSTEIVKQTKQYAKRQLTWARTQYKADVVLPEPCDDIEIILKKWQK